MDVFGPSVTYNGENFTVDIDDVSTMPHQNINSVPVIFDVPRNGSMNTNGLDVKRTTVNVLAGHTGSIEHRVHAARAFSLLAIFIAVPAIFSTVNGHPRAMWLSFVCAFCCLIAFTVPLCSDDEAYGDGNDCFAVIPGFTVGVGLVLEVLATALFLVGGVLAGCCKDVAGSGSRGSKPGGAGAGGIQLSTTAI